MADDVNILYGLKSSYERAELEQPKAKPQLPMPGISYQANDPHRRPDIIPAAVRPYPRWQQNATSSLRPFQLVGTDDDNSVRVVAGTVNSQLPDGFVPGDDPPFLLDISGEGFVYIQVGIDSDDNVNQVSVEAAGTIPGDGSSTFYQQIGTFGFDSNGNRTYSTTIGGSQQFELCGGVQALWGLV